MEQTDDEINCELLNEELPSYDYTYKLIVIGDSGVGKSCLSLKAITKNFDEFYKATVGFEFLNLHLKIDKKTCKLQIWDTCGEEIYKSLISSFYKNVSLAMMVYAIDNHESFEHLKYWLNELKIQANPDVKIFLIGNKSDLEEQRAVSNEEAITFVKENNIDYFVETSAKTGFNATEVFFEAAKTLYKAHLDYIKISVIRPHDAPVTTDLNIPTPNKKLVAEEEINVKKKKGCC